MNAGVQLLLALPIILFTPCSSANAQNELILDKLTQWNDAAPPPDDESIKVAVRKSVGELYRQTASCLGGDIVLNKLEPATADRFAFNGRINGTLKNAWFVMVQLPNCDTAPVRFMVLQQADASLNAIRVNRGTSHAWESLIADTFTQARLGADVALKRKGLSCSAGQRATLGVIRIKSEEPDLGPVKFGIRYAGSWTEIWPIELCGHTVEVAVAFKADGDGGAYSRIASDMTRVLP